MDYESSILEFLAQKENIIFTLEIGERVEQVKNRLQETFWENTRKMLAGKLIEHEAKDRWEVSIEGDLFNDITKNWNGLNIKPRDKQDVYLYPVICQESNCLYYSIVWNKEPQGSYVLPEVLALTKKLVEEKYKDVGIRQNLGWKWTNYKIRDRYFLLSVSNNNDVFASDVADFFWEFFIQNIEFMDAANTAITQAIKMGSKYP